MSVNRQFTTETPHGTQTLSLSLLQTHGIFDYFVSSFYVISTLNEIYCKFIEVFEREKTNHVVVRTEK